MMDSLSGISIGHDRHYSEKVLQASKSGRTSPSEDSSYNPPIRPWAEPAATGRCRRRVCIRFCSMIFIRPRRRSVAAPCR